MSVKQKNIAGAKPGRKSGDKPGAKSNAKPRWKRRPDARPSEIADVALDMFAETGYDSTALDDIARNAGVSKGTIYLYFQSKEDLLVKSVEMRIRENQAKVLPMLTSSMAGLDGRLTRVKLKKLLDEIIGKIIELVMAERTRTTIRVVMAERQRIPKLRKKQKELATYAIDTLTSFLAHAHESKAIQCPKPRVIARLIAGMIISLPLMEEILIKEPDRIDAQKEKSTITNFALNALGLG